MIKRLISTLVLTILFQTPAFAEVGLDNDELLYHGKIFGVLFCAALKSGARTMDDVLDVQEQLNNPDINLAGSVHKLASPQQKKVFIIGFTNYTFKNCQNEMERYHNENL